MLNKLTELKRKSIFWIKNCLAISSDLKSTIYMYAFDRQIAFRLMTFIINSYIMVMKYYILINPDRGR